MLIEISIILIFIILLIYSNYKGPAPPQPMWDRITFNPFKQAAPCPEGCKKYSFPDDYLTPSLLTKSCGYKQDTFVYPCPSTCCDKRFSIPNVL